MIKTLEKLEELCEGILSLQQDRRNLQNLEESTEFMRGVSVGKDRACNLVLSLLREIIKNEKN